MRIHRIYAAGVLARRVTLMILTLQILPKTQYMPLKATLIYHTGNNIPDFSCEMMIEDQLQILRRNHWHNICRDTNGAVRRRNGLRAKLVPTSFVRVSLHIAHPIVHIRGKCSIANAGTTKVDAERLNQLLHIS